MTNLINTETDLVKKGYSKNSVKEIIRWDLLNTYKENIHIPDLKAEKRIGVIKKLSVNDLEEGYCDDLVIILKPFDHYREKININNLDWIDRLLQIEHSLGYSEDVKKSNSKIIKSSIKIIVRSLRKNWKWDVLILSNKVGHISGQSAGSGIYLSLLSAFSEVPISKNVAITGEVNEKNWQIKAIGGLEGKITAAVEKGVNIIIIPEENRNDYDEEVPGYVKEKIIATNFVQETKDLHQFLQDNYFCYECDNEISSSSFFLKNEKDKHFCSDFCRSSHFAAVSQEKNDNADEFGKKITKNKEEINNSSLHCDKCYKKIKGGETYWTSSKGKSCDSCHEEKIEKERRELAEEERIIKEAEKIHKSGKLITLTYQQRKTLSPEGLSLIEAWNQELVEKHDQSKKKNDSFEDKIFIGLIIILVIAAIASVVSRKDKNNQKKQKI